MRFFANGKRSIRPDTANIRGRYGIRRMFNATYQIYSSSHAKRVVWYDPNPRKL